MQEEDRFIAEAAQNRTALAEIAIKLRDLVDRCYHVFQHCPSIGARDIANALDTLCTALLAAVTRFIRSDVRMARLRRNVKIVHERTINYCPVHRGKFRGSRLLREIHMNQELILDGMQRHQGQLFRLHSRLAAAGIP